MECSMPCASLSPLGSHCVAFFSTSPNGCTTELVYLSCLERDAAGSRGVIATLPAPTPSSLRYKNGRKVTVAHGGGSLPLLVAVRPDRFIYFSGPPSSLVASFPSINEGKLEEATFACPLPNIRPLFLLEPLLANALCQDGAQGLKAATNHEVQFSLQQVLER